MLSPRVSCNIFLQEWHLSKIKAKLLLKMDTELKKKVYQDTDKLLRIQVKPTKKVIVTKAVPKGDLKLCPATTRFDVRLDSKEPASGVPIGSFQVHGDTYVATAVPPPKHIYSPWWYCPSSKDADDVNLELVQTSGDIPVFTNSIDLSEGDELCKPKQERTPEVIEELQPVAKRIRMTVKGKET